ncbi:hypothetical protein [Streptomyces sp. NPDC057854]|uniref:hypothetical protein n=1 Tax=unclassified Streptomyces TaxID=2593676 RepID=UPI00368BDB93
MAFPEDPLGVRVGLQAGGVWTDVTADVYTRDPINIARGKPDGSAVADPSRCTLTLNNAGGKYSPRNPLSPYFGAIGRNTPLRVSVPGATRHLFLPDGFGRAVTPDHAALDITSDIDIRADFDPTQWLDVGAGYEIAMKWDTVGQRAWRFMITGEGQILIGWSTTGSNIMEARSSRLTVPRRRYCVRATLDVNNGLGGWTATFYMAETMAGPWVEIGQTVTTSGTTSIFASTAALEVGDAANLVFTRMERRIYSVEVRSGINGTVVANPDFTAQTPGTTGFTDGAGRVWTIDNGGIISDRQYRFFGEVSSWPPQWAPSGEDMWTSVEAAGVLRRLQQGRKALPSTLRRRVPSYLPLAYWPCEDSTGATHAASALVGGSPLAVSGWDMAQDDTLGGSSPLPSLSPGATMRGSVPVPSVATNQWALCMPYRMDGTAPAAEQEVLSWTTTGTVRRWRITMGATGTHVYGYDSAGALAVDHPIATGVNLFTGWWRLEFAAAQSGGNIAYEIRWTNIGSGAASVPGTVAGVVGRVTQVDTSFGPALPTFHVGHITVWGTDSISSAYHSADHGFTAEAATDRLVRLAREAQNGRIGVFSAIGQPSTPMGQQRPDTLIALMQQCADSDLGMLTEDRASTRLTYRARSTLYNQPVRMTLDYSAGDLAPPLEPVDDDQATRNDITVNRISGSSSRAVLETGPMSVEAPPNGVGLYDTTSDLSLATDDQPQHIAGWLLHLGTWDESRVPVVHLALHRTPHLIEAFLALELGDRIQITNTPPWLPPGPIDLIVQGISETPGIRTWTATLTCVPAGPWTVAVTDDPVRARPGTDGTTLGTAVTQAATSMSFVSSPGPAWTTTGPFPIDALIGGEQIRITGITGTGLTQTATVVRSVNGISKPHAAGAPIQVLQPATVAL